HLLHRRHRLPEVVHVQLLETRTRDLRVEVDALEQRVDLDRRLRAARQRSLRTLARHAQTTQRTLRRRQVLAELALELRAEVLHHPVIEVLAAQVRVVLTSKMPSSIDSSDTSKVPPPRSKIRMFFSPPFWSRPYAMAV
ncbi:hypothetical protein WA556_004725, partial [Blastocystis sp. ATCC 50177/Nand II]